MGGGEQNTASSSRSTVGGGFNNDASGDYSTVPGGRDNTASEDYSFAAGRRAKALCSGCFVFADSTNADFTATGTGQRFLVRATGGLWFGNTSSPPLFQIGKLIDTSTGGYLSTGGTWTNSSDRASKEDFAPVDVREVLQKVAALPISSWSYRVEDDAVRHLGPMGQDFHSAFGLGDSDKAIGTVDADGVALAAIQGLYELLQDKEEQINQLTERLAILEKEIRNSKH